MDIVKQRIQQYAIWLVLLSGTLYGFLGYFGTQLLKENLTISTMLFWRFFIAGIWMLVWSFFQGQTISFKHIKIKSVLPLLLVSIFYACSSLLYFYASEDAGTGLAMVIFFSYPIFVALMVWARHYKPPTTLSLISLIVVMFGLFLLQKNDLSPIRISSIVLALGASLSYALYIFKSKQISNLFKPEYYTMSICFISAGVFLVMAIYLHQFSIPSSFRAWSYIISLGVLVTALPIQLLLYGLKSISSLKVSILSALEPVVTLIVGIIALDEAVSFVQLMGVIVIIIGTFIIQFSRE